jgi:hypothetical protein
MAVVFKNNYEQEIVQQINNRDWKKLVHICSEYEIDVRLMTTS